MTWWPFLAHPVPKAADVSCADDSDFHGLPACDFDDEVAYLAAEFSQRIEGRRYALEETPADVAFQCCVLLFANRR
jgi:hypothetical protein